MTPRLSVVVPFYNVGEYIGACLDSIARQTWTDFEAILVDDGSPDDSAVDGEGDLRPATPGSGSSSRTTPGPGRPGTPGSARRRASTWPSSTATTWSRRHGFAALIRTLDRTGSRLRRRQRAAVQQQLRRPAVVVAPAAVRPRPARHPRVGVRPTWCWTGCSGTRSTGGRSGPSTATVPADPLRGLPGRAEGAPGRGDRGHDRRRRSTTGASASRVSRSPSRSSSSATSATGSSRPGW